MAPRKGSLSTALISGAKAAVDQVDAEPTSASPARMHRASEPMITTAVHIPKSVHNLLRKVAVERANNEGGRPSVSAVLTDLVERHRAELEQEVKGGS